MLLNNKYPLITNLLECYIRPEVDTYNWMITLHAVMKDSPAAMAAGLVKEFDSIAHDSSFSAADIAREFNKEVPDTHKIMTEHNAHQILIMLHEYIVYLYEVEGLKGNEKWDV